MKLWDWDLLKSDDLVGEMVFPLHRVVEEDAMKLTCFTVEAITPGEYDLKKARLWLRFTLGRKEKPGDLMTRARKQQEARIREDAEG